MRDMYFRAGAAQSEALCQDDSPWAPMLLGPNCPLFARKFPENTASQVRLALKSPQAWLSDMLRAAQAISVSINLPV